MSIIIPSYLVNNYDNFSEMVNQNHSLKVGNVIDVTFPEGGGTKEDGTPDPKKPPLPPFPLYTVMVSEKVGDVTVNIPFKNCILRDIFGTVPDFFEYSLRRSDYNLSQLQNTQGPPTPDKLLGANVLIECINGSTFNAVILGAVRTYNLNFGYGQGYTPTDNKTGKYLNFNFNGINAKINDDGEFTLKRLGPQNNDGTTQTQNLDGGDYPKDNAGSLININQAGDINISAGTNQIEKGKGNIKFTPNILLQKSGKITISSGIDDNDVGAPNQAIIIDPDGTVTIQIDSQKNLVLKNHADDATLTLGSGTFTVAVAEKLQQLYEQLLAQLQILTVSTGTGPSGPPLNAAAFPQWDSSINSGAMKIPK